MECFSNDICESDSAISEFEKSVKKAILVMQMITIITI